MSYILDALRRAERERHLGQAPSLAEITQAMDAPSVWPRRPMILTAAGLAAVAVAALVYGLWPQAPFRPAAVPAAPAPKAKAASTPAQPTAAAARTETPPAAPATTATTSVPNSTNRSKPAPSPSLPIADIASLDDLTAPPKIPVTAGPSQRQTLPQIQPFDAAKTAPHPNPASAPAPSNPPLVSAPAGPAPAQAFAPPPTAAPASPQANAAPSAVPPAAAAGVTNLRDMPASFRADFPPINVDVHFWDENPQRRFVLINLHRYKEGEHTAEGLTVVAIVPDGIVFDYRGQRVLYALTR